MLRSVHQDTSFKLTKMFLDNFSNFHHEGCFFFGGGGPKVTQHGKKVENDF